MQGPSQLQVPQHVPSHMHAQSAADTAGLVQVLAQADDEKQVQVQAEHKEQVQVQLQSDNERTGYLRQQSALLSVEAANCLLPGCPEPIEKGICPKGNRKLACTKSHYDEAKRMGIDVHALRTNLKPAFSAPEPTQVQQQSREHESEQPTMSRRPTPMSEHESGSSTAYDYDRMLKGKNKRKDISTKSEKKKRKENEEKRHTESDLEEAEHESQMHLPGIKKLTDDEQALRNVERGLCLFPSCGMTNRVEPHGLVTQRAMACCDDH